MTDVRKRYAVSHSPKRPLTANEIHEQVALLTRESAAYKQIENATNELLRIHRQRAMVNQRSKV